MEAARRYEPYISPVFVPWLPNWLTLFVRPHNLCRTNSAANRLEGGVGSEDAKWRATKSVSAVRERFGLHVVPAVQK